MRSSSVQSFNRGDIEFEAIANGPECDQTRRMRALGEFASRFGLDVERGDPGILEKRGACEARVLRKPQGKRESRRIWPNASAALYRSSNQMTCLRPAARGVTDDLAQHSLIHASANQRADGVPQGLARQF